MAATRPITLEAVPRHPAIDRSYVDRWIYVFTAALFVVTALVGFGPRSLAILEGERAMPPLVVHVHAALMAAWFGLLLLQTVLMASGRRALHRTLGLVSLVLAPAMVAAMIAATIVRFHDRAAIGELTYVSNVLLGATRSVVCFAAFWLWAILVRKKDKETHKRMIVLATAALLPAAITRMTWLPNTMPESIDSTNAYMLLLLLPAVAWDIVRRGRPYRAYVIGLSVFLALMIAMHFLWNSPWWLATAPRIMGVET
jgi:hypothetical protein